MKKKVHLISASSQLFTLAELTFSKQMREYTAIKYTFLENEILKLGSKLLTLLFTDYKPIFFKPKSSSSFRV